MPKFNTITISRKDLSIIGVSYDPTIPDRGDYRDEVARMFIKKMQKDGFDPRRRPDES